VSKRPSPPVLLAGVQRELVDAAQRGPGGEHRRMLRLRAAAIAAMAAVLLMPAPSAALTASSTPASMFSQTVVSNV
jgi:hypothetical protein